LQHGPGCVLAGHRPRLRPLAPLVGRRCDRGGCSRGRGGPTVRRAAAAALIAFCLAAGTPAAAHPLSFPDEATVGAREEAAAPTSLVVPVEVLHILERAAAASPWALELDREEALADSRHRAQMAALTTSTGWRATVQARQEGDSAKDGVAGAFQWVVRYPIGRSELAWSIGPG